jgi:hypothetical protein
MLPKHAFMGSIPITRSCLEWRRQARRQPGAFSNANGDDFFLRTNTTAVRNVTMTKYMKTPALLRSLILISLFLSACTGAVDQSVVQTSAAQTLDADLAAAQGDAALQTSEAENAALQATIDALAAEQDEASQSGTQTAVAAATLAAVPTQLTAPAGAACRSGPDGGFGKVVDLAAGEPVDALARSLDGEWWQVSPEGSSASCWVFWTDDLAFTGDVFNLPMVAGPSLPTATFEPTHEPGISARFENAITCSGTRVALIRVLNLGPETYQ